jgi:hypothetical protein
VSAVKPPRTREAKLDALLGVLDWLGTYEGDEGTIESGSTEGIPADLLAGHALLVAQVNELLREQTLQQLAEAATKMRPELPAVHARQLALRLLKEQPGLARTYGSL